MGVRSRHFAAVVAAGAAIMLVLAGCTSTPPASTGGGTSGTTKAPYKLGAVLSLTGTYSGLGVPEKNTLDMEVAAINAAGGVNGHQIEVVIADDATDAKQAVSAVTKLIEQDKVIAVLGATGTGQTMAMRPDIDRAGIPNVSLAGGNAVTAKLDKLVFATPWSNGIVVPFELKYLQKQGITKIAILADTGFGKDGRDLIVQDAPKYGISISADESFKAGDTDMTAQLTKIKGTDAQALVVWNAGAETAIILKNVAALKMTMPVFGSHGNARKQVIDGAGAAAEGFIFPAGKVLIPEAYGKDSPSFKVATDFIARYTKKYGAAPSTFAGHAYDALYITATALKRLNKDEITPAELRDEIEKTSGFAGIGGTFTFSPTDHNGMTESDLVMYKVQNGTWVLVK